MPFACVSAAAVYEVCKTATDSVAYFYFREVMAFFSENCVDNGSVSSVVRDGRVFRGYVVIDGRYDYADYAMRANNVQITSFYFYVTYHFVITDFSTILMGILEINI